MTVRHTAKVDQDSVRRAAETRADAEAAVASPAWGQPPTTAALRTAIVDFERIASYLDTYYVTDLQGIMENKSGKFHIIDPGKIERKSEANREAKEENSGYDFTRTHEMVRSLASRLRQMEGQAGPGKQPATIREVVSAIDNEFKDGDDE